MNLTDSYKLSVYEPTAVIKETDYCTVSLVRSSLDGKTYIKKDYADNKAQVYGILKNIRFPNLPEIKEIIDGRIIVEEFVEGETLEKRLSAGGVSNKQAKRIFDGVLAALDVLHKNGIVHRDVKPSNIIIRPDGTPVLVDFGISKLYNSASDKDTSLLGTVGYAPPEQFGFSATDFRSDVYSFGVTAEKLGVRSRRAIVEKCKAFDPAMRYANAGKVIENIRKRRNRIIAVSVIAVVIAVVLPLVLKSAIDVGGKEYGEEITESQGTTEQSTAVQTAPDLFAANSVPRPTMPKPTEPPTLESSGFSTTKRLEMYDYPQPYRAIETEESMYSILIMSVEADEKILVPLDDEIEIEVHYIIDQKNLKLTLYDGRHRVETEFAAAQITMGEYISTGIITEIVFYDIDGDGIREILPIFCHTDYEAVDGNTRKLVNSWEGYCIKYSPETGFRLCEGSLRVLGSESESLIFENGEILFNDKRNKYVISNGRFERA